MSYHENLVKTLNNGQATAKELAEFVGVTERQVFRWRAGNCENMGIDKLKKVCQYYGVSADYILGLPKGLQWPK